MKILREWNKDETERVLGDLDRRLARTERGTSVTLPTAAQKSPKPGQMWFDVAAGKLYVWNGSAFDAFTKD